MINLDIQLTPEMLNLIAEIDEFKGKWEAFKNLSPERLQFLQKAATVESVASSTRIEGATLSDQQVETLLNYLDIQSFSTRDEQEVASYAETMNLVYQSYADIKFDENHIKQLHNLLLQYSEKDKRHKGAYKKLSNNVAAFNASGKQVGIIFKTATPFETPEKMRELITEIRHELEIKNLHPLLIIAIFIVSFLAIHPFQDGNGRLSRILTSLLLLQCGYDYVPYASIERVIEENKDFYYKALRKTQITLEREKINWEPWILFFLRSMQKQKNNLLKRLETEKLLATQLSEISTQILTLLKNHPRLTIGDIVYLTGVNKNTLKVRLRELVKQKLIAQHGKARATWYGLA